MTWRYALFTGIKQCAAPLSIDGDVILTATVGNGLIDASTVELVESVSSSDMFDLGSTLHLRCAPRHYQNTSTVSNETLTCL